MCITCMITWLASLVPSFFVSYLAFFSYFSFKRHTRYIMERYMNILQHFLPLQSRNLSRKYSTEWRFLPCSLYEILSYRIKSQRRTSFKGISFFHLGSPPSNKAKTQFKTFCVLLLCNHIKLNFSIFTSSCTVNLFFHRFKMFLRIFLFFFLMVLTSCSETKKDTQDPPSGLLQALRSKYLGHIRGKRTVS